MKKVWTLLLALLFILTACHPAAKSSLSITNGSEYTMEVGETVQLQCETENVSAEVIWSASDTCVDVSDSGLVTALREGSATVTATAGTLSDSIEITVTAKPLPREIELSAEKQDIFVGETVSLSAQYIPNDSDDNNSTIFTYEITAGSSFATISGNQLTGIMAGNVTVIAKDDHAESNAIEIKILDQVIDDPYVNMTKEEFYSDYQPATSYWDAYYRTQHGFMSGDISAQDQAPTISDYQPQIDGLFARNASAVYTEDGNTYYVLDAYGEIVNRVFKGGAYVTLEEVAAYVFAFGDIPANYTEKKSGKPQTDRWGEYLRLNHSYFSGNTKQYPYEPLLPDIRGAGGQLYYYEIDIGTTGTDCDPGYTAKVYNDGYSITRGAARIVYTRYDANGDQMVDINEKYVFYTYNHYNDFQEYLNYAGGWGEKFGNITGGGTLSSKTHYNPTDYVPTVRKDFYAPNSNLMNLVGLTPSLYATYSLKDAIIGYAA